MAHFLELRAKEIYLFFSTRMLTFFSWELGLPFKGNFTSHMQGKKDTQHYKSIIIQGRGAQLQNFLQSSKWVYDRPEAV